MLALRGMTVVFFVFVFVANCYAESAKCSIDIEDGKGTHYEINEEFEFAAGVAGDRKTFKLPGSDIECNFVFFDKKTGTALACELDEIGQNYVQSDRSLISETEIYNNLTFRYNSKLFTIKTYCKN